MIIDEENEGRMNLNFWQKVGFCVFSLLKIKSQCKSMELDARKSKQSIPASFFMKINKSSYYFSAVCEADQGFEIGRSRLCDKMKLHVSVGGQCFSTVDFRVPLCKH